MKKNVIKARLVRNNEAVALGYVEPFDMARNFDDIAQLFRACWLRNWSFDTDLSAMRSPLLCSSIAIPT